MRGYRATTYGESFADVYDDWYHDVSPVGATVAFVTARLEGTLVELGSGTGRLAGPLRAAGSAVVGLDVSAAMLTRSRSSHPDVPVVLADMTGMPVRSDSLGGVLVAFNTLFNLPDRDAQAATITAVADALAPGGLFVAETFVPGEGADSRTDAVELVRLDTDLVVLRVSRTDPATRSVAGHHVELRDGQPVRLRPWRACFATPEELDGMAADAGLRVVERFGGWDGDPYTAASDLRVCVYEKDRTSR